MTPHGKSPRHANVSRDTRLNQAWCIYTLCARALLSTSQPLGFSNVNHQLQGKLGVVKRFDHAVLRPLGFLLSLHLSIYPKNVATSAIYSGQRGHLPISLLILQTNWVPCFRRGVSTNIPWTWWIWRSSLHNPVRLQPSLLRHKSTKNTTFHDPGTQTSHAAL